MFRPIRRTKREISEELTKALLASERRGVLAVNGDDGYPYAVPINYLYDGEENKIYFHGALAGHKYDSISRCEKVCFTVYGHETIKEEAWAPYLQSAVVFGKCIMVKDEQTTKALLKKLAMKYYPEEKLADDEIAAAGSRAQMYVIEIEHLSGKEIQER